MKRKVLFVCIGNACRSQMAETFARAYGYDIMEPLSAGLAPAINVDATTRKVMGERNLSMEGQFSKPIEQMIAYQPTLIINMSGSPLPHFAAGIPVETWQVRDPVGEAEPVHREVRNQVESLVMQLILRLRNSSTAPLRTNPVTPTSTNNPTKPVRYKFGRMG